MRCLSFDRIKRRRTTGKLNLDTATTNNFDEAYELTVPPPRYEELPLESKLQLMTDEDIIAMGQPVQPHEATQVIDADEEQEIAEEPVYMNVGKESFIKCLVCITVKLQILAILANGIKMLILIPANIYNQSRGHTR